MNNKKPSHPMSFMDHINFLVFPKAKLSSGPLFFTRSLSKAVGNVPANGSFGLVATGKKTLLVTCDHVVEKFKQILETQPEMILCACLDKFNPVVLDLKYLIDHDPRSDLAVFDMDQMLPACAGREFAPIICGHVERVKKGDRLMVVGYPGRLRREADEGIYWGTVPHLFVVADISGFSLVANTSRVMDLNRHLLSDQHENPYGGVSGSPCFLMRKNFSISLVAFVSEDHKAFQIIKFTSAERLNADGTIKR